MPRKRLLWQLYPSYLLLTVVAVLAVAWYTSHSLRKFYFRQVSEDIKSRAYLVLPQIAADLTGRDYEKIDRFCKTTGPLSTTRITVILPDGNVIGDSDEQVSDMNNHADRPEFRDAMKTGLGRSERPSDTLGKNMMYLAIPIYQENEILAVVRTSVPVSAIDDELREIYLKILWAVLIVAVLAAVISLGLSKRISRPIETIKEAAARFASGDLALRLTVSKPEELADLAKAMNKMAHQLDQRIKTITTQGAESDAILSSMIEGVIAIDSDGQIVRINHAAAGFFNINTKQAERCPIEEAIDNTEVIEFIQKAIGSASPTEAEVIIPGDEKRHLKLHAARLSDSEGNKTGAVIVLTDTTQIKQLEKIRRDFVANVSHELKTPITSIKGFVETLQEGALTDPEQANRFLEIIARHADRLNAIIDDLLTLSRLEEGGERRALSFEMTPLKPVLTEAVELSKVRAEEKQIQINLDCAENIEARVNPALLEQAVTNLINNAIKYSEAKSSIVIKAEQTETDIRITVRDQGCGIDKKYQERIFERFYVVDKSRSRKLGGTGLGLAIVKHIAQVHNAQVTVESQPGAGSTFTIHLPQ
jgi:two-component system phosphate regulon sensor histidine kinase PhoR